MEKENDVRENESNALTGSFSVSKFIEFLVISAVTAIVWNLPSEAFGIDGLTVVQQRIIATFVFAMLMWLTETIPPWATSLCVITIMLFTVSDNSLPFFRGGAGETGALLSSAAIMATFADPTIILFLGGFILALAATKSGLDIYLAHHLIKPFGNKSENVLLGFILITGVFSMFVSNTATAAMMLTFLTPVFKALPANGKGRIALTLSIPVAANLGGIATPIGTPPNVIALKYLNDPEGFNMDLGFGQWTAVMLPFVLVMLFISWLLLKKFFPFTKKTIELHIDGDVKHNWRTVVVAVTFIVTILFWVLDKLTGINSYTVAVIPMGVFALTGVITAKDMQSLNWSVLWMVAGGFALGLGLNDSGLADAAIKSIPFGEWSPIAILVVSGLICYLLSNFISNTATAALLIPILAVVCRGMSGSADAASNSSAIIIGVAIAASSAMCLPISTPPNAIAHSTGLVKQSEMVKIGLTVGVISLVLGYTVLIAVEKLHLL